MTHLRTISVAITSYVLVSSACGPGMPLSASSPVMGKVVHIDLPSNTGALVSLPAQQPATTIDGFAPSCEPCRDKVPALVAQQAGLRAGGVQLVLIAVLEEDESTEDARGALVSWGVPADQPFLVDRGAVLQRELGVSGLPASVVLDSAGTVRWVAPPDASADDVAAASLAVAAGG